MTKKGISLVGIKDTQTVERIRENYPDCYFELSYMSTPEALKEILPIVKDRVASIHLLAPVRDYFPNLASKKALKWSCDEILKDAEFALSIGAENLVLHPGYLVDGLVSRHYPIRLKQLQDLKMDEYVLSGTEAVCSEEYIKSKIYKDAFSLMCENALALSEKIRNMGLHLALENLNPRCGYMILHPDEIISLAKEGLDLCVDVGHLQVNSAVFGFDVLSETKRILDTGMVRTMHLHSNESSIGIYKDSHSSLDRYLYNWKDIISYGEKQGANLILEVLEEAERNVSLLF